MNVCGRVQTVLLEWFYVGPGNSFSKLDYTCSPATVLHSRFKRLTASRVQQRGAIRALVFLRCSTKGQSVSGRFPWTSPAGMSPVNFH